MAANAGDLIRWLEGLPDDKQVVCVTLMGERYRIDGCALIDPLPPPEGCTGITWDTAALILSRPLIGGHRD